MSLIKNATDRKINATQNRLYNTVETLYYIGVWPEDRESPPIIVWLIRRLFLPLMSVRTAYDMTLSFIGVVLSIYHQDAMAIAEGLISIMFSIAVFVRVNALRASRQILRDTLETIQLLNDNVVVDEHNVTVLRRVNRWSDLMARELTLVFFWGVGLLLALTTKIVLDNRQLPFAPWIPYDTNAAYAFEMTAISSSLFAWFSLMILCICETTFTVVVWQISAQYSILRHNLENIQQLSEKDNIIINTSETSRPCVSSTLVRRGFEVFKRVTEGYRRQENFATAQLAVRTVPPSFGHGAQGENFKVSLKRQQQRKTYTIIDISRIKSAIRKKHAGLCTIAKNENKKTLQMKMDNDMELLLGECVVLHQTLIKISKDINSVFNIVLANQIILNAFMSLCAVYVTILVKHINEEVLVIYAAMLGIFGHFLFTCSVCNKLTSESEGVRDSAFKCNWIAASASFKRNLRILMSQQPTHIYAAMHCSKRGIPLSMKTFRLVTMESYRLYTVLYRLLHRHRHH